MARIVKSGLIQMSIPMSEGDGTIDEIKEAAVQKHIPFIEDAGKQGSSVALEGCRAPNGSSHEREPSIWLDSVSDCHGFTGHYHTPDPQSHRRA